MKVLVTGATGFIGRRLVQQLLDERHDVVALARNDKHGFPEGVTVKHGDILAPETLKSAAEGCERLYHLAAMISFDPAKKDELARVNETGTRNALEAARRQNIARSVVVSSACTFGLSFDPAALMDENAVPSKKIINANPYLASKLGVERAAREAAAHQHVTIVNPTTVYGPGDRTLNSGALIMSVARSKIMPVPSGGGNVIDVDDAAGGIIAAGERGRSGARYILGAHNLTFKDICSTVADVVGHKPIFIPLPSYSRPLMAAGASIAQSVFKSRLLTAQIINDMFAYKFFSSELAKKELGWVPKYSFSESVARAWSFYKSEGMI